LKSVNCVEKQQAMLLVISWMMNFKNEEWVCKEHSSSVCVMLVKFEGPVAHYLETRHMSSAVRIIWHFSWSSCK
jgi:hypothetical protein